MDKEFNELWLYWKALATRNGITRQSFYNRVVRHGWDAERAANQPIKRSDSDKWAAWKRRATRNGVRAKDLAEADAKRGKTSTDKHDWATWGEIATQNGITRTLYMYRITRYGWSREQAATTAVKQHNVNQIYELYDNHVVVARGTVHEIAEQRGVKVSTIKFLKTPSYRRRNRNGLQLIPYVPVHEIDDYDEFDY